MLGHPYRLTGKVDSGAGRGRTIGVPTANLIDIETMLPRDGVYAGRVTLDDKCYPAAVPLGPNPTFADGQRKLEVHIVDFTGDLYRQTLSVDLFARVRDTMQFPDPLALQRQLQEDIAMVREICRQSSLREGSEEVAGPVCAGLFHLPLITHPPQQ